MAIKELIYLEDAINSIAESEYYFLSCDGHGIDEGKRKIVAKDMLRKASEVKALAWKDMGGNTYSCPRCESGFYQIDTERYSYCPCCGHPMCKPKEKK